MIVLDLSLIFSICSWDILTCYMNDIPTKIVMCQLHFNAVLLLVLEYGSWCNIILHLSECTTFFLVSSKLL